mgnify:CR=1 FL=1
MSVQIFKPNRELTFDTVRPDSHRLLKLLCDKKTSKICFNLQEVVRCDSAGLALLIEAKRLCKQYGKQLSIEGMSEDMQVLAKFCGVEAMLQCQ